jgi:hypothetical protein
MSRRFVSFAASVPAAVTLASVLAAQEAPAARIQR